MPVPVTARRSDLVHDKGYAEAVRGYRNRRSEGALVPDRGHRDGVVLRNGPSVKWTRGLQSLRRSRPTQCRRRPLGRVWHERMGRQKQQHEHWGRGLRSPRHWHLDMSRNHRTTKSGTHCSRTKPAEHRQQDRKDATPAPRDVVRAIETVTTTFRWRYQCQFHVRLWPYGSWQEVWEVPDSSLTCCATGEQRCHEHRGEEEEEERLRQTLKLAQAWDPKHQPQAPSPVAEARSVLLRVSFESAATASFVRM